MWPEGQADTSDSKSVDALTYGLSTLCLGSSFARTTRKLLYPGAAPLARLKSNNYGQYTRKFSLGNGPKEWVAEYMITKESGKMLGTLVALALAKMVNLETFVWDMPTGVLSDIFMALSSLAEQADGGPRECKLDKVWVRWHDHNDVLGTTAGAALAQTATVPMGTTLTPIGIHLPVTASHPAPRAPIPYARHTVEYPTFSVLPPVRSLAVLDIDELSYLDEMAMLVERSQGRLQELRVGIALHAKNRDFVQTWDGPGLRQVDHKARWPGASAIGERRLGGVLGVLVGRVYDIKKRHAKAKAKSHAAGPDAYASVPVAAADHAPDDLPTAVVFPDGPEQTSAKPSSAKARTSKTSSGRRKRLEGKLRLETLALERISLSMHVCRYAFDWSVLTSLTILDCLQHENLWKMLKRQFQPTPLAAGLGISAPSPTPPRPPPSNSPMQYHLALKHLHTDATSPALVAFVKEALAPNSLEVLFLQDKRRASGPPPVSVDQLFKGPLKRHRSSLRKVLLDSSSWNPSDNNRWRAWVLTTEMLVYMTSGRMASLAELSVAMDHRDWVGAPGASCPTLAKPSRSTPSSSACPTSRACARSTSTTSSTRSTATRTRPRSSRCS